MREIVLLLQHIPVGNIRYQQERIVLTYQQSRQCRVGGGAAGGSGNENDSKESSSNAEEVRVERSSGSTSPTGNAGDV